MNAPARFENGLRIQLAGIIAELGEQEVRVLIRLAERLRMGQATYGRLDLANDSRDLVAELSDEVADLLVYTAMAWLKRELHREQNDASAIGRLTGSERNADGAARTR